MTPRRCRRALALAMAAATAAPAAAPAATAVPRALPALAPGAAPVPVATAAPATAVALATLRPGSRGAAVADLQRALRRRGYALPVDGAYGPRTTRAVRAMQRRLRHRLTGRADARLLRALGIVRRAVASGTAAADAPAPAATTTAPVVTPFPSTSRYVRVFPVQGQHGYVDSFGAPRGQGPHQGTDIMSPRGTPVVAVADGWIARLTRVETGLGGLWVWTRDRAGNTFYYAHLSAVAGGIEPGSRVTAGQAIGAVGNTGDARWGATHLHFEIHPGGAGALNPYPELRRADPSGG